MVVLPPSQMASADDGDVYYYVDLNVRNLFCVDVGLRRVPPTRESFPRREMGTDVFLGDQTIRHPHCAT